MNINSELTCKYCNTIFNEPIMLACGENICKHHLEELISNKSSKTFTCPLCNEENATNQQFVVNKIIQRLIKIELHAFKLDPKYVNMLNSLKVEIEKLAAILNDPKNYIYEEISKLKRQVDLDRENLKIQIDEQADNFIQQLESYEKRFKAEYKANVNLQYFNGLVESSRKKMIEYEQCLIMFSTESHEREAKYNDCESLVNALQPSLIEIQNKLFSDLSLAYQPAENDTKDLFGKLIIRVRFFKKCININVFRKPVIFNLRKFVN